MARKCQGCEGRLMQPVSLVIVQCEQLFRYFTFARLNQWNLAVQVHTHSRFHYHPPCSQILAFAYIPPQLEESSYLTLPRALFVHIITVALLHSSCRRPTSLSFSVASQFLTPLGLSDLEPFPLSYCTVLYSDQSPPLLVASLPGHLLINLSLIA